VNIKENILKDLKEAQKAREVNRVRLLRGLISSINNAKIDKCSELDEEEIIEVLRREVKQRKDAIDQYQKGGREDLVKSESKEVEVTEEYLPKMMSKQRIEVEVKKIINKTGANGISDMGKVMGQAMDKLKGRADGAEVKKVASKFLK